MMMQLLVWRRRVGPPPGGASQTGCFRPPKPRAGPLPSGARRPPHAPEEVVNYQLEVINQRRRVCDAPTCCFSWQLVAFSGRPSSSSANERELIDNRSPASDNWRRLQRQFAEQIAFGECAGPASCRISQESSAAAAPLAARRAAPSVRAAGNWSCGRKWPPARAITSCAPFVGWRDAARLAQLSLSRAASRSCHCGAAPQRPTSNWAPGNTTTANHLEFPLSAYWDSIGRQLVGRCSRRRRRRRRLYWHFSRAARRAAAGPIFASVRVAAARHFAPNFDIDLSAAGSKST